MRFQNSRRRIFGFRRNRCRRNQQPVRRGVIRRYRFRVQTFQQTCRQRTPVRTRKVRIHRGVYHCVCGRAYRRVAVEAEH